MKSISHSIKTGALTIVCTTALLGCGGSNSGSPENEGTNTPTQDNPFIQQTPEQVLSNLGFSVKRQDEAPITEENAEALILDAIKVLDYLVDEHAEYVNDEGGVISVDSSLPTVLEQPIDCNQGGVQIGRMNAPSQLIQDGLRVYGDGDSLSIEYQGCDYLGSPIWGTVGIDVDQGVWDLTHAVVPDTMLAHFFNDFFYLSNDGSILLKYHDGTLNRTIENLSHKVESEEFAIFDYQPAYDIEIVLSNVDFTVSQFQVNDFWNGDQIMTHDLLTVESNHVQMQYHIAVTRAMKRAEVASDAFEDGAMAIAGQIGTLYVQFRDSYLDYELDLDSDGIFEISGVIDGSEY